jgi:hypothetical protein
MSSNQQKMYNHASNVVRLLSSDLPEEAVIKQIGDIVVGLLSLLLLTLYQHLVPMWLLNFPIFLFQFPQNPWAESS